jgi:hypothetical protein
MKYFPALLCCLLLSSSCFSQRVETKILRGLTNDKIEKYETIEIGLRIPENENAYRNFFNPPLSVTQLPSFTQRNPYTEKFLRLQFICHGKTYNAQAFYMQDATPDEKENRYVLQDTEWPWHVRFAVPDTGSWQCLLLVGEDPAQAVPKNAGISFQCIPGNNHGYLKIAPDKKHFQYSDGTLFFAIGQNIAWADEPVLHGHAGPPPVYSAGYFDVYKYINSLADNGGNYVRIVMVKWSTGIEWERAGVYDQSKACALDSMISLAEKRGLKVHLCINPTLGYSPREHGTDMHIYRQQFQKPGQTASDLVRDSSVLFYMDNYLRYVHARWAYSPAVACMEIIGEVNTYEGYLDHENYFSNFYSHVDKLIREEFGDNMHIISTSTTNTQSTSLFENSAIGFVDMHHYDNNFKCNQKRFKYVQQYSKKFGKPFLFGEMGMIPGPVNAADPDDYEHCNDISFHNAMWATAFMGAAGTGLYWWQWKFDAGRESTIKPLSFFLNSIVGGALYTYEPGMWTGNGLECFYQKDSKYHYAFGWVHNTSYWWGNMTQNCRDRNGKQMMPPKDDDKALVPEKREGNDIRISGFASNKRYEITFYDTRTSNTTISSKVLYSNALGVLHFPFPGGADYAFKIKHFVPGKF